MTITTKPVITPGSITAGNVSQVVQTARPRSAIEFYNTSDTIMYLNFGTAALVTSIPIPPGGSWYSNNTCASSDITVLCAVTGKTFSLMVE